MRYVLAVVEKELAVALRRPIVYINLLLVPAVLALLASFAFRDILGSSGRLPLLVVDLDGSAASSQLSHALSSIGDLRITRDVRSGGAVTENSAVAGFQHGRRPAVLVIPSGYGAAVASGRHLTFTLYTDPAQPGPAALIQSAIQAELDRVALTATGVRLAEAQRPRDASVRAAVEGGIADFLASPPVMVAATPSHEGSGLPSPWEQTVPGFAILFSSSLASRFFTPTDQERRIFGIGNRLYSLHAPRWCHIAGKLLATFLFGAAQFAILLTAAHMLFDMKVGSAPTLAVVVAAYLLIPVSVGVAVTAVFKTRGTAGAFIDAWGTLMPTLGGALIPVFLLPGVLSALAHVTPYYWALQGMQDVMVRGATLADVWLNLLIMIGFAVVVLAVFVPRFSYRLGEAK